MSLRFFLHDLTNMEIIFSYSTIHLMEKLDLSLIDYSELVPVNIKLSAEVLSMMVRVNFV